MQQRVRRGSLPACWLVLVAVTAALLPGHAPSAAPNERATYFVRNADLSTIAGHPDVRVLDLIPAADGVIVSAPVTALDALAALRGAAPVVDLEPTLDSTLNAVRADPYTNPPAIAGTRLDGSGVTIAVVDSGVDGTHPMFTELDGSSAVVRNLETACPDPVTGLPTCVVDVPTNDSDTTSASGHGTAVASVAAGRLYVSTGGVHLQGVAPGASIVAISTGAATTGVSAALAFAWIVEHHADPCGDGSCPPIRVVNASFTTSDHDTYPPDDVVSVLQEQMLAAGITISWGAGNSGGDGSQPETNPWGQTPTPGAIVAGAVDELRDGRRDGPVATFSSRGQRGEPATYPDLVAPGGITTWACRPQLLLCGVDDTGTDPNVGSLGGTSASAPYVTGAAALLLQADPRLTPARIEHLLEASAHPFGDDVAWEEDPAHPGTSTSFDRGHGLLDVGAALAALAGTAELPATCDPKVLDAVGDVRRTGQFGVPVGRSHLDVVHVRVYDHPADATVVVRLELDAWPTDAAATYAVDFDLDDPNGRAPQLSVHATVADGSVTSASLQGPSGSVTVPVVSHPGGATVDWWVPHDLAGVAGDEVLHDGRRLTNFVGRAHDDELADRGDLRCAFRVGDGPIRRIAGPDRYATAAAVARASVADGTAPVVVLARGDDPDDALVAGPLAAALDGPVLLTGPRELPEVTRDELRRSLASQGTVVVVGGTAAVSAEVTGVLDALGVAWERVAGPDRYATAAAVARRVPDARLFAVAAATTPDALVAAAMAAREGGVMLLSAGDQPTPATDVVLADAADRPRIAVGGPAARAYATLHVLVGGDRYATAALAGAWGSPTRSGPGITTHDPVADGLAAAPFLARADAPLLLDHPAIASEVCPAVAVLVGGPAAIPPEREDELRCPTR